MFRFIEGQQDPAHSVLIWRCSPVALPRCGPQCRRHANCLLGLRRGSLLDRSSEVDFWKSSHGLRTVDGILASIKRSAPGLPRKVAHLAEHRPSTLADSRVADVIAVDGVLGAKVEGVSPRRSRSFARDRSSSRATCPLSHDANDHTERKTAVTETHGNNVASSWRGHLDLLREVTDGVRGY